MLSKQRNSKHSPGDKNLLLPRSRFNMSCCVQTRLIVPPPFPRHQQSAHKRQPRKPVKFNELRKRCCLFCQGGCGEKRRALHNENVRLNEVQGYIAERTGKHKAEERKVKNWDVEESCAIIFASVFKYFLFKHRSDSMEMGTSSCSASTAKHPRTMQTHATDASSFTSIKICCLLLQNLFNESLLKILLEICFRKFFSLYLAWSRLRHRFLRGTLEQMFSWFLAKINKLANLFGRKRSRDCKT